MLIFNINFNFTHKKTQINASQLICKPSSVIEGNHQSRCNIAVTFKRSREQASSSYVPHLAPHGVYSELLSPIFRVSSYLTFSPLPEGCIFLLHFSSGHPGLTLSSVIALWCSDFPHPHGRTQSSVLLATYFL